MHHPQSFVDVTDGEVGCRIGARICRSSEPGGAAVRGRPLVRDVWDLPVQAPHPQAAPRGAGPQGGRVYPTTTTLPQTHRRRTEGKALYEAKQHFFCNSKYAFLLYYKLSCVNNFYEKAFFDQFFLAVEKMDNTCKTCMCGCKLWVSCIFYFQSKTSYRVIYIAYSLWWTLHTQVECCCLKWTGRKCNLHTGRKYFYWYLYMEGLVQN